MGRLGVLRAQKFPARRQIKKKLAHFNAGAWSAAASFDSGDLPAVDEHFGAFRRFAVAFARGQGEAAHAGDARQGFAPKAHRGDRTQILRPGDFAGRVPFQAEQRVVPAHAQAVVGDANEAASAGLDFNRQARGLGVEGILHQFLDHAGGALDDLAGGDLVGHLFGQQTDAVHLRRASDYAGLVSVFGMGRVKPKSAPPPGTLRAYILP